MVRKEDLNELRRIATNMYDDDKRFVNRVIHQINLMERKITSLETEIKVLKEGS